MSKTRSDVLTESKKKGVVAGACAATAVGLGVFVSVPLAAFAAVPAAYFGYKWWRHRAENGIKF